jgi:hypothetical protein
MKHYIKYLFIAVTTVFGIQQVTAQGNTIYYMGTLPQSYYMNPATQPQCDFYFGIPIASHVNARVTTGSLSATDFYWTDPNTDSLYTWRHPNANLDEFLGKLDDVENWSATTNLSLMSFGFRVKEMYFSLDVISRNSLVTSLSKDFLEFSIVGNENSRTYDFSDVGFEALTFTEFGINISRRFGDNLQVGIRPKFLFGLATINTLNNTTNLYTSTEEWHLSTNYNARIGLSGIEIPVDEDGIIDPEGEYDVDSLINSLEKVSDYTRLISENSGLGIDFGVHYKPIDRLQLSLSVIDLGYIKWRSNTNVITADGDFTYNGLNGDSLIFGGDPTQALIDSLKESLSVTGSASSFTTKLNSKIFVGARYFLTPGFDVGVLSRTEFLPGFVNQDLLLLANWHPIPLIAISGSYNILSKTHSTFGLGLGLKLGPLNFYTVLEDIPFKYDIVNSEDLPPLAVPVGFNNFSVRFGVNLMLGCNQKKKLKNDKPLFNSSDWIL